MTKENKNKKLVKYIKGMAQALNLLAKEIEEDGEFGKESKELLSKIGSHLLFEAVASAYRSDK